MQRKYCVAWRPSVTLCVCVRRISLTGEGNALYPVLSGYICSCDLDVFVTPWAGQDETVFRNSLNIQS